MKVTERRGCVRSLGVDFIKISCNSCLRGDLSVLEWVSWEYPRSKECRRVKSALQHRI